MKQWNYKIISGLPSEHALQGLGVGGWELVCVSQFSDGVSYFYFKRPFMTSQEWDEWKRVESNKA